MSDSISSTFDARLGRRAVLRSSLLALGGAAFLAACGDRQGPTDPGVIGYSNTVAPLPELGEPTDAVWLRTLQSIEYSILAVHAGLAELGGLPGKAASLAAPFAATHQANAEALTALIEAAGGEPFECGNPFFDNRYVNPVLTALADTDDFARDAGQVAYAFEEWAARSYQYAAEHQWESGEARAAVIAMGAEANRRAAGISFAVDPTSILSPLLTGGQAGTDEDGFATLYAIPTRFGQVSPIELRYGRPNVDGAYATVSLQTPADNSLLFDNASC